eukprot:gnl/MRDRNA2_/MRDRNA2_242036_c0_seq1.p1 gnl/MRDRNA2_/MRDRNA2_242036_c0~~gnl/MRDRNA2_/MRDRNA2_242036_c0_seq1.p1  ORF type:complete len:771 (+),score=88.36 gnl/MRDRNA2_/MRDRNA2_242036_c0_seq1:113-2425(+)
MRSSSEARHPGMREISGQIPTEFGSTDSLPPVPLSLMQSSSEARHQELTEALSSEWVHNLHAEHEAEFRRLLAEIHVQQQLLFQSSCRKLLTDFSANLVQQRFISRGPPDFSFGQSIDHDTQPQQQTHVDKHQSCHEESIHKKPLGSHIRPETKRKDSHQDKARTGQFASSQETLVTAHESACEGKPIDSHTQPETPKDSQGDDQVRRPLRSPSMASQASQSKIQSYRESASQRLDAVKGSAHKFLDDESYGIPGSSVSLEHLRSSGLSFVKHPSQPLHHLCTPIANSHIFEWTVNIMILLNTLFMAVTINHYAVNLSELSAPWTRLVDIAFTVFFVIDLVIRMGAQQKDFFRSKKDKKWNMLDLFIVVTALAIEILNSMASSIGFNTKFIRIVRLLRLIRAFRFLRVARSLSELRFLLAGITNSFGTLLYAVCLLTLFTFIFALFIAQRVTSVVVDMANTPETTIDAELYANLRKNFGSLTKSMFTLIQVITGGDDWGNIAYDLFEIDLLCGWAYVIFCAFGICVLMNVVTGVFISKALDDATTEKTNILLSSNMERKKHMEQVEKLFRITDDNGDGELTREEFRALMLWPCVEAYFKFLGLDYEAWEPDALFELMDFDENGTVSINEFVYCCSVLKGTAQRLDLVRTQTVIMGQMDEIRDQLSRHHDAIDRVVLTHPREAHPMSKMHSWNLQGATELFNPSFSQTQNSSVESLLCRPQLAQALAVNPSGVRSASKDKIDPEPRRQQSKSPSCHVTIEPEPRINSGLAL